jgi:putative membrane protein
VLSEEQKGKLLAVFEPGTDNYKTVKAALDYYNALPDKLRTVVIPEITAYDAEALGMAVTSFNTAVTAFSQDLGVLSAYLESISKTMEGMKDLPAMVTKLQTAAKQLADGSCQLKEGIKAYTDGVGAVHDGVSQLADGMGVLPEVSSALNEGYDQILEGTWSLADGMKEFDEQGIQEIAKLGSGQMKDMIRRAKALRLADGEYVNYAGITEGTKGSVRFLIETGKIETD